MYKIGEKYEEFTSLREKISFDFDGLRGRVVALKKYPKANEIEHFQNDDVFFQLFLREGIIFLLIKFNDAKWLDIPYVNHHKIKELKKPIRGFDVEIMVANANTGELLARRLETFNIGLSLALFWAISAQLKDPPKDIIRKINKVHAAFSSDEMARLSLGKA